MSTFHAMVIGAGPRGTSFLERLLAQLEAADDAAPDSARTQRLRIDVVDPYPAGAGHVWRTDQDPLFLMNTPALFPTVAPVGDTTTELPASSVGESFQMWLQREQTNHPLANNIQSSGFPPRALYGSYLKDQFDQVAQALRARPEIVELQVHQQLATGVHQTASGAYQVVLESTGDKQELLLNADALILALGHVPAHLNPNQAALANQAATHGLTYIEPNISGDVDWGQLPAQEPVLVRGMGLNFFDVMIALTQGRGGSFSPSQHPGRLTYEPSGTEPTMLVASRRGVPYRAKAVLESYYPATVSLRYFTPEHVEQLVQRFGQLDFLAHLWPLLNRDATFTYYRTLVQHHPERFIQDPAEFMTRFEAMLNSAHEGEEITRSQGAALLAEYLPAELPQNALLDVRALGVPAQGLTFATDDEYQLWVQHYIAEDIDESLAGLTSPVKMAIGALNLGREFLKELIKDGKITEASRIRDLAGWFSPLLEGLASGPPVQRTAELLALAEAGIVKFIGPAPIFAVEPEKACFSASSPWVHAEPDQARHLVEAMMPANQIQLTASVFLQQLLAQAIAEPWMLTNEDGLQVPGQGFRVSQRPYRLPGHNIYVLGLQLSSAQWGTAIAAEAGASGTRGARTLADADAAAWDLLKILER